MKIEDLNNKDNNPIDISFRTIKINDVSYRILIFDNNHEPENIEGYSFLKDYGAIGFIDIEYKGGPKYMLVDNVYLSPEYRGSKLGYKLYNEALRVAQDKGYKGIGSNREERNIHTDHIWKKIGQSGRKGLDVLTKPINL